MTGSLSTWRRGSLDYAVKDMEETVRRLESTLAKAEEAFTYEQRQLYKRLLRGCQPQAGSSNQGFLHFLGHVLRGKSTHEARRLTLEETQREADEPHEDELEKAFTLVDTLPFSDLKNYYNTALDQGLGEANRVWARREVQVFGRTGKGAPLSTENG